VLFSRRTDENSFDEDEPQAHNSSEAPSMLTVIADSAEVEVIIIDKQNWSFFPEVIQKDIQISLEQKTSVESPFTHDYHDFVKDLFKQWDNDKLQFYVNGIKDAYE
jgi:hypothetical protein